jgi:hypothetical protein
MAMPVRGGNTMVAVGSTLCYVLSFGTLLLLLIDAATMPLWHNTAVALAIVSTSPCCSGVIDVTATLEDAANKGIEVSIIFNFACCHNPLVSYLITLLGGYVMTSRDAFKRLPFKHYR